MFRSLAFGCVAALWPLLGACRAVPERASPMTELTPSEGFLSRETSLEGAPGVVRFVVYVPRRAASAARLPLVVFLHGRGECGNDGLRQMINGVPQRIIREPEKWPSIVVMPQKPDADRPWMDYEPQLMAIIEQVRREWPIDGSRIYLTGLSQGGAGTWALAAAHPDVFAAIAPVCGFAGRSVGSADPAEAGRIGRAVAGIPTWAFHGEADSVVPIARTREIVEAVKAAGGTSVRFTAYPNVNHGSWENAYAEPEFTTWLFAQQRRD